MMHPDTRTGRDDTQMTMQRVPVSPLGTALPKDSISVGLVREAVQVAVVNGLDLTAILSRAGIAAHLLDVPRARVTSAAYAQLWAVLADTMDDEFFGMDSHPMRRGSFQLMSQAAQPARTLERALQRMLSFLGTVLDDVVLELLTEGGLAVLRVQETGRPKRVFTYATLLIMVHGLACWLVRRRIPLIGASFRGPVPQEVDDYRIRFCATAVFDAPVTQVCFNADLLSLRPVSTELGLQTFLRSAPANLLVRYRDDASLAAAICRRLRRQEPSQWPELDDVARDLRLAPTTMQRRLHKEGASFQSVKDNLRRDMAIGLLCDARLPVAEVASRVGFLETSSFHRAFRKWTGASPGAYRVLSNQSSDGC